MKNEGYDVVIVGSGIFGLTSAIELVQRGYKTALLNPGKIPHPLAASTDISKVVRMEYGADRLYGKMGELSIQGWKKWNNLFEEEIYQEVGFLLLCQNDIKDVSQRFEYNSMIRLEEIDHPYEAFGQ